MFLGFGPPCGPGGRRRFLEQMSLPSCQLSKSLGKVLREFKFLADSDLRQRAGVFALMPLCREQKVFRQNSRIVRRRLVRGHCFGRIDIWDSNPLFGVTQR